MARIKTKQPADAPAGKAKSKARAKGSSVKTADESPVSRHPLARRRGLVVMVLGVVALLMLGGSAIWRRVAPLVAGRDRYLLQADGIAISQPPEWIVGDVRGQVIATAGLAGRLSILDPNFLDTISHAFALHPWVESVTRIEKRYPPGVYVELAYRRPVAVVDVPLGDGTQLLPVDAHGVHLPADDVPLIRRTYLPRITGVVGQPPAGQRWDDPRVAGAVDLAVRLGSDWEALNLVELVPSARPEVQGDRRYYLYDLVTRGGTRIVWGAAPQDTVPGEAEFAVKLSRLKQCVAQYATLDWVDWPAIVDVRRGIAVTPRTAKKPPANNAEDPVVAEKPPAVEPVVK